MTHLSPWVPVLTSLTLLNTPTYASQWLILKIIFLWSKLANLLLCRWVNWGPCILFVVKASWTSFGWQFGSPDSEKSQSPTHASCQAPRFTQQWWWHPCLTLGSWQSSHQESCYLCPERSYHRFIWCQVPPFMPLKVLQFYLVFFSFFLVPGIEPRTSCLPGKPYATELHPRPCSFTWAQWASSLSVLPSWPPQPISHPIARVIQKPVYMPALLTPVSALG